MSSGSLIIGNLTTTSSISSYGDVSLNTRLFLGGDSSMGGRLFVRGDSLLSGNLTVGKNITIVGSLVVQEYTNTNIINTITTNVFDVSEDISLNGRLFTSGDASFGGKIYAANGLSVNGPISIPNNSIPTTAISGISSYATLAGATFIGSLAAANGLTVTGPITIPSNSIPTTAISGINTYATLAGSTFTAPIYGTTLNTSSTITSAGLITANNGLTVVGSVNIPSNSIPTTAISGINAYATLAGSTFTGPLYTQSITSTGLVNANAGLTVPVGQSLTTAGTLNVTGATITGLNATSIAGLTGVYAPLSGSTFTGTVYTPALISSGLHIANAGLTVPTGQSLTTAGTLNVSGATITGLNATSIAGLTGVYAPLSGSTFTGPLYTQAITSAGLVNANAGLTVPIGQSLTTAGTLNVTGATITGLNATSIAGLTGVYAPLSGSTFTGPIYTQAITSAGLVNANAGLTVPTGQSLTTAGTLNVTGATITGLNASSILGLTGVYAPLSGSTFTGPLYTQAITSAGLVNASAGLTVPIGQSLTTAGSLNVTGATITGLNATSILGLTGVYAPLSGATFIGTVYTPALISSGLHTANAGLTVPIGQSLTTAGTLNVTGATITGLNASSIASGLTGVYAPLSGSTFTGFLYTQAITAAGLVNANAGLTIPSGQSLTTAGTLNVTGATITGFNASSIASGLTGIYAPLSGSTFTGLLYTQAITAAGLVNANAGLTVPIGQSLTTAGTLNVTGATITGLNATSIVGLTGVYAPLSGSTFTGPLYTQAITTAGLVNANSGLTVSGSDTSLNGRLFVLLDSSMNGNLTVGKNITILGNLTVKQYTANNIINTITTNVFDISEDLSLNGRFFTSGDASLNGRLFINKDLSLNGNLSVGGSIKFPFGSIPSTAITGGVQTNGMDLSTNQIVNGMKTFNGVLATTSDVSLNGRLYIGGNITTNTFTTSYLPGLSSSPQIVNSTNFTGATQWGMGQYSYQSNVFSISKATGQYQIAVNCGNLGGTPLLSTNYGVNWTSIPGSPGNVMQVSISYSGQYIIMASYNSYSIYVSNNYGSSFTTYVVNTATYGINPALFNGFLACACSGNGQYMLALIGGGGTSKGFLSTNYGVSFAPITPVGDWTHGVISETGQYQFVGDGYKLWISSDYGASFTSQNFSPSRFACSNSGQYVMAFIPGGNSGIYVSSNYGATWSTKGANSPYCSLAISDDGKYQYAVSNNILYESSDYGATFTLNSQYVSMGNAYAAATTTATNKLYVSSINGLSFIYMNPGSGSSTFTMSSNTSIYKGDLSLNGNLFVGGSINFPFGSIPSTAITGGVQTNGMDLSTNQIVNGMKTFNGILNATSDASFNGRFFLGGDASLNGRLFIARDLSVNGNLTVNNFAFMNSSTYSNVANSSTVKMSLASVVSNQLDLSGSFSINNALGIGTNNPQFQLDVGSGGVGCGRVVQFGNGSSVISSGVNTTVFASNFTTDASVNGNLIVGGNVNLMAGVTRVSRFCEKVYSNNTSVTTAYTFDVTVGGTIMNLTAGAQTANFAINLINIPSDLNQTFTVTILSTGNFFCNSVSTSTTSTIGATTVAATPKWIGASAPSISGATHVMQSITIINNNTTVASVILSSANAYA